MITCSKIFRVSLHFCSVQFGRLFFYSHKNRRNYPNSAKSPVGHTAALTGSVTPTAPAHGSAPDTPLSSMTTQRNGQVVILVANFFLVL